MVPLDDEDKDEDDVDSDDDITSSGESEYALWDVNCADFLNVIAQRHVFGGAHQRVYDPQIRTRPRFLYNAPTPKFHHPMFARLEVIVLTNKQTNKQTNRQTDAAENIQRSLLGYDVG